MSSSEKKDQIRIGPEIAPGKRATMRRRDDKISTGSFGGLKEGQPIPNGAEIISLGAPDPDGWHDVNVLYRHEEARAAAPVETVEPPKRGTSDGPPQVATPAYREGWSRVYAKKLN